jgi:hypothetical protein
MIALPLMPRRRFRCDWRFISILPPVTPTLRAPAPLCAPSRCAPWDRRTGRASVSVTGVPPRPVARTTTEGTSQPTRAKPKLPVPPFHLTDERGVL